MKALFNGKDLTGWDGDTRLWSVKDGVIRGETTKEKPAKGNTFLIWRGGEPADTFRVELVCIVDSVDTGMLVARTERLNLVLPASPVFHWAKRAFERTYLRRYQ